jgi:phytoene dehydrogenase-like protein
MNSAPPSLAQEFAGPAAIDDYRFQFQSARSWADENFESPEIRNFFACCALHACLAPDDALGGQFAWLFAAAVQDVGVSVVKGGMHHVSRALDRPVPYRAGPAADQAGYVHAAGQTLDDLADMFAQARAGLLPATPMVGIINEAGIDPSRAPDGKALMKFVMHFVPYRVTGDARGRIGGTNWDEIKETYADAMIDFISETYLPGLRDRIIARAVQSPVDLERRIKSAVHGTHQHGAYLPYQVGPMHPIAELGSYRSPIANVYLCGAGSHPGSGVRRVSSVPTSASHSRVSPHSVIPAKAGIQ